MIKLQQPSLIPCSQIFQQTMLTKEVVVQQPLPTTIHNVTIVATRAVILAEVGDKQWNIMKVM